MKIKIKKSLKIFAILVIAMLILSVAYMIWEDNQHYIYRRVKMVDCIETEVVSTIAICNEKENLDLFLNQLQERMGINEDEIEKLRDELENRNFRCIIAVEGRIENEKICIDHFSDFPGDFKFECEETPGQLYIYTTNANICIYG